MKSSDNEIKGLENYSKEIQTKVLEIHELQMRAFGGKIKGHEIKEVFTMGDKVCVRFINNDWYHYDLNDFTWY